MENKTKVTKVMVLNAIREMAEIYEGEFDEVTAEDIIAYVDTTIKQIHNKAERAKTKAAEKRAEGDALRDAVKAALTDEYKTIAEITESLDIEGVTPGKVVARLTQLVKADEANKTDIKIDGRRVKGYALGAAPTTEDDAE